MKTIAEFEKVSFEQFEKDFKAAFPEIEDVRAVYDQIRLPSRATAGSAGYDFFAPIRFTLQSGEGLLIPTGIRAKMEAGWVLQLFPRSGLGFKHRLQLDNTVGIIDSDYYGASNEGHIMIKLTCDAKDSGHGCTVEQGSGFAQGIFLPYGLAKEEEVHTVRDGGFGSTTK